MGKLEVSDKIKFTKYGEVVYKVTQILEDEVMLVAVKNLDDDTPFTISKSTVNSSMYYLNDKKCSL